MQEGRVKVGGEYNKEAETPEGEFLPIRRDPVADAASVGDRRKLRRPRTCRHSFKPCLSRTILLRRSQPAANDCRRHFRIVFHEPLQLVALGRLFRDRLFVFVVVS